MLLLTVLLGFIFGIGIAHSYDNGDENGMLGFGLALILLIAFYVK